MRTLLVLALVGCSTPSPPGQNVIHLAGLDFQASLEGWTHKDAKEIGRVASRWTPDANPNKESISIIRAPSPPRLHEATIETLTELLESAQGVMPEGSVHAPVSGQTKQQLPEVEIAADFVPAGLRASYHRVHAMILDGNTLIHVLYTARTPDPNLTVFRQIVDSIHQVGQS